MMVTAGIQTYCLLHILNVQYFIKKKKKCSIGEMGRNKNNNITYVDADNIYVKKNVFIQRNTFAIFSIFIYIYIHIMYCCIEKKHHFHFSFSIHSFHTLILDATRAFFLSRSRFILSDRINILSIYIFFFFWFFVVCQYGWFYIFFFLLPFKQKKIYPGWPTGTLRRTSVCIL